MTSDWNVVGSHSQVEVRKGSIGAGSLLTLHSVSRVAGRFLLEQKAPSDAWVCLDVPWYPSLPGIAGDLPKLHTGIRSYRDSSSACTTCDSSLLRGSGSTTYVSLGSMSARPCCQSRKGLPNT